MEKNFEEGKINLFTILVIAVILISAILGIAYFVFNGNTNQEQNKPEANTGKSPDVQNVVPDNNEVEIDIENSDFAFDFLKLENKKQNMIYSPLSIKYALNMLNDGANGETKNQIDKVLKNTKLSEYSNKKDVLSLANGIFIRDSYSNVVKDGYIENIKTKYKTEIQYDEFKNANKVNDWISDKTFGQIKNMLTDDVVSNDDTALILINALAMDMEWAYKFDDKDTCGKEFYLDDGKEMKATMMSREEYGDDVSYYLGDDVTVLTKDLKEYDDVQMEFVAIMPNDNLSDYINNFNMDTLEKLTNKLKSKDSKADLFIHMPKFSFEYNLKLKEDLIKLGIKDVFDKDLADLSNMSSSDSIFVSDALHKARIDFTEKGIKAAAVTVVLALDSALEPENKPDPIHITIDKPFMYVIREKKTGEIWFVGSVYEPNSWDKDKKDYEEKNY